jgi:SAM-dependent methyltransferase
MSGALQNYRQIWDTKPVLRTIYGEIFDRIALRCVPGTSLEIGGGIGNLKTRLPDLWTSDIQYGPWLDLVADAQCLPFADGVLGNIVMLDVLHHVEFPILFFREAARKLRPGGRIIMVEPAITWGSTLFYRLIHHEAVDMSVDPLLEGNARADRNPYDSNQALPTLIATRYRDRFHQLLPDLEIIEANWFSFAVYPLSGGFKPWSLIPSRLAPALLRWERAFETIAGPIFGFRMLLAIEKRGALHQPGDHHS